MELEAVKVGADVEAWLSARCPSKVGWVVDCDGASDRIDGVASSVEFTAKSFPS